MNKTEVSYDSGKTFRKFGRNAVFNVVGFLISTLCYMAITPFSLRILGKEKFGTWALTHVVTSFARLSNLGLDKALVKYIAEFWAQGRTDEINKTVNTAFLLFMVIGGVVVSVLLPLRSLIVCQLFRIPEQLQKEAIFVVTGVLIIFFFNIVFSVYKSVLLGLQRMDITNGILVASRVLITIGVFFFLSKGLGLKGLVINSAIVAFLVICADILWVKKIIKDFSMSIFLFSISHLKRILKYGINVFLSSVANMSREPINKIVLTSFVSLSHVTFYEIGTRIQGMIWNLFGVSLSPLLPASSEFSGRGSEEAIERIYIITSRFILLLALPFFVVVALTAIPFARVWLGEEYELAGRAIQFLLIGNFISLLVTPAYIISLGIGKPHLCTIVSITVGVANLATSILLGILVGYYGVLIGIASSLILGSLLMVYLFHRSIRLPFIILVKAIPTVALATVILLAIFVLWISSHVESWSIVRLVAISIAFLIVYAALVSKLGLNLEDKQRLKSFMSILQFRAKQ